MPQKFIARQKTEATPGNYWGLPIKGPGFLLQIITAAFFTAPICRKPPQEEVEALCMYKHPNLFS